MPAVLDRRSRRALQRLAVAACLGALAWVRDPEGATEPGAAQKRVVRLDFEVVDRFLEFADRGGASSAELKRWVRLPGNRELLREGQREGGLTAEILEEAARVTLSGGSFPSPPTLGNLSAGDWSSLKKIVESIRTRQDTLAAAALAALDPYLPPGHPLPPLEVRFHLGGTWDGRSTDAVYINLTLFQSRGEGSLAGLDALLVHELFHQAQAALLPGVEDYSSRQSALYTVLLRMQQEGIARHLEYRFLSRSAPADALDRTNLGKYADGLRRASEHAADLEEIRSVIQAGRLDDARVLAARALLGGGPLYAVGHGVADAIESARGPAGLASTVATGPLAFARAYVEAVPHGAGSLLSQALLDDLAALRRGYARDPLLATRLRREGLALLAHGRPQEARDALKQAVRIDPTDSTSAYNLACAFALAGKKGPALKWLEESFDRGFDEYKHAALDGDLRLLWDELRFEELLRSRGFKYRRPGRPRDESAVSP
jgi:tetratricopeptide (TPR) repeat protein